MAMFFSAKRKEIPGQPVSRNARFAGPPNSPLHLASHFSDPLDNPLHIASHYTDPLNNEQELKRIHNAILERQKKPVVESTADRQNIEYGASRTHPRMAKRWRP